MDSLPVVLLGFLLGMLHATDADHVVAVSTIVSRERRVGGAACVGALWGIGHSLTVLAVGSAIILFNLVIPPRLEQAMEFCVALMLMALGVATLSRVSRHVRETLTAALAATFLEHATAGAAGARGAGAMATAEVPQAPRANAGGSANAPLAWLDRTLGGLSLYQALRPLSIGIVHGLAGSAAVALLVLAQIRDPAWAAGYLLLFGIGTTAGMVLVTTLIAVPFSRTQRLPFLNLGMQVATGALSLILGGFMAWQLGVADGLFVTRP